MRGWCSIVAVLVCRHNGDTIADDVGVHQVNRSESGRVDYTVSYVEQYSANGRNSRVRT